jgi:hypothetical protein
LLIDLDHVLVDVTCPACGFPFEVQLLDARTQVWRWCPCCRVHIRLVEPDGSVSRGLADAEAAMRDLENTMRNLFG